MSNLIKPYEISVWDDVWESESSAFVEKRLGIIGTDKMQSQNRALEANFSRNVNGVKKLSFKMYKQYKDSITGEDVINPYIDWLVSERKVKLYYEDQWHDFIVKNIVENSSNYLYTYQLEDALVQELSKNGFGKTLDAKLKNNMGTANELAEEVLKETDWEVAVDSEAFVQTIDEALVYLTLPSDISGLNIKHIKDQTILTSGVPVENATGITGGKTILAFYSSCTNKPHRFQFIYVSDLSNLQKDENRNIINKDCQYYIDFDEPEAQYTKEITDYGFTLPTGFDTTTVTEKNTVGVTLSSLYRGKRYGFTQQSIYAPVLNKYVKLYDKEGEEYYGYEHTEYKSPALTQNIISNTTFDSTSGWTGTHNSEGKEKAKIENVFGYFENDKFVDSIEELQSGKFMELDESGKPKKNYKAYLKITFPNSDAIVVNSGPFDNRTVIGKMEPGDEWALHYVFKDRKGDEASGFNVTLGEYSYTSITDGYSIIEAPKITFNALVGSKDGYVLTKNDKAYGLIKVNTSTYSEEEFKKKMKVRVCIAPPSITEETVYYLEEIELFKAAFNKDKTIIIPEEQGIDLADRVIDKTYYYFKPSALENISNEEQLVPEVITKTLSYKTYKPKYNEGAQKVRSVSAKESNYFNILQSIAETFEAWLVLKITRGDPDEPGKITKKEIAFKNYAGNKNYAGFRYGVNLKDIQRTYESKNIVTKLIVKQNSNELGENGFCTIARAGANPTGENCIYDFQYFFNRGLINPNVYLNTMYVVDGAKGPDVNLGTEYNLQGYFPRIKVLNKHIQDQNEILINTAKDLTQYKAELEVAEAGKDAANSGVEQTREDFEALTGVPIDQISVDKITEVSLPGGEQNDEDSAKEKYGYYYRETDWLENVNVTISGRNITVNGTIKTDKISQTARDIYVKTYPKVTLENGTTIGTEYAIKCTFEGSQQNGQGSVQVEVVDVNRTDVKRLLQEFAVYNSNEIKYAAEMETAQKNVDTTQEVYDTIEAEIDRYKNHKIALNQEFFSQYSRFIQEGTWISEEYADDEKYYADAQSVMYNSCYPQVAYSINVVELSKLPGYEHFTYGLGDRTYVEDFEFFGEGKREEVVITEINEMLDDPSKNVIKVQNFKNQFQDLFQKITATVQQAQYSTGSYEKAVALAEANQARKQQFLTEALDSASARLSAAGQQSVTWGNDGITVKSVDSPCDAIRMVGGAILLSKQDKNGQQKWVTGVTSDGVSASLITAGIINAGEVTIMNYDQPVFRWDSFGISAYDANWYTDNQVSVVSGVNSRKFVRFDKHGIYGINNAGVDGASWYPGLNTDDTPQEDIDKRATFALTWDGLKVTNSNNVTLRLGDGAKGEGNDTDLLLVNDSDGNRVFAVTEDGSFIWSNESSPTKTLYSRTDLGRPTKKYSEYTDDTTTDWHKLQAPEDWYASYSYDGGNTWTDPVLIQSAGTKEVKEWYYATSDENKIPTRTEDTWYLTPSLAGHGAINKYLWNYEETILTNDTSVYSVPALITTQPKNIEKIYEFYLVTSGPTVPNKPTNFEWKESNLNYDNTNPSWTCIDTSDTMSDSGLSTEQSQYLWNFEVVCYDDETCSVGAIANIGTGGKGIDNVINYYQATATETKPIVQDGGSENSLWKLSITDTGHGESSPFLWTYEETSYSAGSPEKTPITLLARTPRTVASITEYYQVLSGTAAAPATITLKNNNNEIDSIGSWSTTYNSPVSGQVLWNCEVIQFSTKDDEGKNLYQVVAPAKIGYIGIDSYTLSLDNDVDVIVYNNAGTQISTLPIIITASRYIGHTVSSAGQIDINPPNITDWKTTNITGKGWYTKTTDGVLTIRRLPANYSEGNFTFVWKSGSGSSATIYDQTKFSLKKIISTVDYDLIIPQTVFNSSQSDGEYTVSVLKKSENGTTTLYGPGDELKLYKNDTTLVATISGDGDDKDNWAPQEYGQNQTTPIKYTLKSADDSIIWDEEVVEFTKDGSSTICVKPGTSQVTDFTKANWGVIKTKGISGSTPRSSGTDLTWTDFVTTNNSSLRIGNSIYIECTVSDKFSAADVKVPVIVYGTIAAVGADNKISFNIDSIIFGAEKGTDGQNGSDATVTYANIWQAFSAEIGTDGTGQVDEKKKGIIPFEANGVKYLGINADLIQTGAINIGGTEANAYKDARLYADIKSNNVYIASWTVSEQYLQNGTFWLYGENSSLAETSLLNSENTSKILIASGEKHFADTAVTEETTTLIPETYYENGVATKKVCFLLTKYIPEIAKNPSPSISYIATDSVANTGLVYIDKTTQSTEGLQIVLAQNYGADLNSWTNLRVRFNISYKPLTDITDFMVLQDGSLYANAFRIGKENQNDNLWISNSPQSFNLKYIGTQSWLFSAGQTLGITGNGTLYAANAKMSLLEVCNSLSFTASDDFDQVSIFNMCKTPYEVVTCGKTSNVQTPLDEYTIAGIDTSNTNLDIIKTYFLDDYWCIAEVKSGWSMTLTTPTTYPCITNQVTIKHDKMSTAANDILTLKGFRIGSNNQAKFSLAKDGSLTSKEGGIGGWYYSIDEGFRTTIANQVSYKIKPTGVSKVTYSESSSTTDAPISWEAIFGAPSVASTNATNIAQLQSKVDTINGWSIGGKKIKYGKYTMSSNNQKLIRQEISTGLTTIEWAITTPDVSGDENDCEMQGGIVNVNNGKITVSYQGQNVGDKIYGVWWMAIGT